MTNEATFTVDSRELNRKLADLSSKEIKKAYIQGMRKAIKPLYKETVSNAKSEKFNATGLVGKKNPKPLIKDIKQTAKEYKSADDIMGRVYISPRGMLKWFENGTEKRHIRNGYTTTSYQGKPYTRIQNGKTVTVVGRWYSKKHYNAGASRGSISKYKFFARAIERKQSECMSILDMEIWKSINKVWESR